MDPIKLGARPPSSVIIVLPVIAGEEQGLARDSSGDSSSSRWPDPTAPRYVTLFADLDYSTLQRLSTTGELAGYAEFSLQVGARNGDAAFNVHFAQAVNEAQVSIRVTEFADPFAGGVAGVPAPQPGHHRVAYALGSTSLSNTDFVNPETGKGIFVDAWAKTPYAGQSTVRLNAGSLLVKEVARSMNFLLPWDVITLLEKLDRYASAFGGLNGVRSSLMFWTNLPPPDSAMPALVHSVYDIKDTANPVRLTSSAAGPVPPITLSNVNVPEVAAEERAMWGRTDDKLSQMSLSELCWDGRKRRARRGRDVPTLEKRCNRKAASTTEVALARNRGVLSTISVASQQLVKAAGIAGLIAAPVFIILDLVHGKWVGAGLAAAGLVLGVVATLAIAGPVGWIVGGLISALFAILPGAFKKSKPVPPINNTTQILQWVMFGDKDHTGNEECRKQGNPNCTAVFGAGVLSSVLKWNNFDSIAFLLRYNEGYAMTLPEIADSFEVLNPKVPGSGEDSTATINCNNRRGNANAFGSWGAEDRSKCNHPAFAIKRDKIMIPVVNQTADRVFSRVIPNPGGDCKLVNDAANALQVPDYNVTITGRPVAIACNITAAENIQGTAVPIEDDDPDNGQVPVLVSSGNTSSDGQNGHYIAPPPPTPFLQTLNATNAVCLDGTGGSRCFPNGTFEEQKGVLGFDSHKANSMVLPVNASLQFWLVVPGAFRQPPTRKRITFAANQTAADKDFADKMKRGATTTFDVLVPGDSPTAVCLFSQADYKGDVACFGPGGGDLPENMKNKAQSIGVGGGASVWIYADEYADEGGVEVTSGIPDLKKEVYGNTDNYNQKIKAMWVRSNL
ncbi:MAG: hypothetical protein M1817_005954 [Caeruleum heppii]|nr:MAG: hypothetical protein M1817_005954 [Caeruleum heppii]